MTSESWDYTVSPDAGRDKPGYRMTRRMERNGDAYGRMDPDNLATLAEAPEHIRVAMEDTLGPWLKDGDGEERIKLRMHPHMRRWALYEREYRPEIGESCWKCFYIFEGQTRPGYLPPDMKDDPYLAHFTGQRGDYADPTRADFEWLEQFCLAKYGYEAVNIAIGAEEAALDAEGERKVQGHTEAFLDENWGLARDEANQLAGSGQFMFSGHCQTVYPKSDISKWRREDRGGYTIVTRKSAEEYEAEIAEELKAFTTAWLAERGMNSKWVPEGQELVDLCTKAGIRVPLQEKTAAGIATKLSTVAESRLQAELRRKALMELGTAVTAHFIDRAPDAKEADERRRALAQMASRRGVKTL